MTHRSPQKFSIQELVKRQSQVIERLLFSAKSGNLPSAETIQFAEEVQRIKLRLEASK